MRNEEHVPPPRYAPARRRASRQGVSDTPPCIALHESGLSVQRLSAASDGANDTNSWCPRRTPTAADEIAQGRGLAG
jgi:hypothetical protein